MKIVNNTHWDTRQLKAILQLIAKQELEPAKRRQMTVTINYTSRRDNSCSGHAWLGGRSCTVRIPKGPRQPDPWTVEHYRKLDIDPSYLQDKNIQRHGRYLETYLKNFDEESAMRLIKLDFAHVAGHEFAHLRGMTHRQMTAQYNDRGMTEKYYGWVLDLPLEVKQARSKRVVDIQEQRYQRVLAAEKRWLSKLKAAQNKVKLYAGKRRYYERAMAAKGAK